MTDCGAVGGRRAQTRTCTKCKRKESAANAKQKCLQCQQHLCGECAKIHVTKFEDHVTVGYNDVDFYLDNPNKPDKLIEQCDIHKGEIITTWCKDHDQVVCPLCITKYHQSCKEKIQILEIPNDVQEREIQRTESNIASVTNVFHTCKHAQEAVLKQLELDKTRLLDSVDNMRRKFDKMLEQCTTADKRDIELRYTEQQQEIEEKKNTLDDALANFEDFKTRKKHESKAQHFVCMKKYSQTAASLEEYAKAPVTSGFEFQINPKLDKFLKETKTFGAVQDNISHCLQIKSKKSMSVRINTDRQNCKVKDLCVLPGGSVLVTDWINSSLKRVDYSISMVTGHLDLVGKPFAVCCVGENEVAVCLTERRIQFVNIKKKLIPQKLLTLSHHCSSVAYTEGELYVIDDIDEKIVVIDKDGKVLRKLGTGMFGQPTFKNPCYVALSSDGDKVYVTDHKYGLVCMDKHGKQLFKYTGNDVREPHGIFALHDGSILVCGSNTHNLIQINQYGENTGEIISRSDGVTKTKCVTLDSQTKTLIVTNDSETLYIYTVKW